MPATIAVIDIGKTNAKVVLIDRARRAVLGTRSTANPVAAGGPYPHCDVERLWRFILDGLAALGRERRIEGISIATHGATAALVTSDGLALPVLDYEHAGPEETAAAYDALRPPFAETLSPRLPVGLNLGAQIFWQARRFPREFAEARHILMYPQYWAWRLTGIAATEVTSLGSHTDLWAPAAGDYSSLVEQQGWGRLMPPIRQAISVLGPLSDSVAEETGLAAGTPVACGIHDSNASLLPYIEAYAAPFTVVSSGTWAICMTVGGNTGQLDPGRDSLAYVDAYGRPIPAARFMAGREYEILTENSVAEPTRDEVAGVLSRQVMALPALVPGVGPFGKRSGGWTVDPTGLTGGERAAAASLYLALVTGSCLQLAGIGRFVAVEGPLARNALYCRALAGLTGASVIPSPTPPAPQSARRCCSAATCGPLRKAGLSRRSTARISAPTARHGGRLRPDRRGADRRTIIACERRSPAGPKPAHCPAWWP